MHLLQLTERIDLGLKNMIEPGEYVIDDVNGAMLLARAGGGTMTPLTRDRPWTSVSCKDPKFLFMRAGGYGDLVLLTPVLREVKRRWPQSHVAVCTMVNYALVLANLPFVDEIIPYPCLKAKADEFDSWTFFENSIERNPRARELNMTELFAEIVGLEVGNANLKPSYAVKATEAIWANEAYPRVNGTRRICIQVGASALNRVFPQAQLGEVCRQMISKGWEVFLLGAKGEIQLPEANCPALLRNLANADLTFRQSCAVLNTADGFIGGDSALIHVAGALGIPAVGLYGSFPWQLRTIHCPTTFSIQGDFKNPACPCMHHVNAARRNHFPENCPSRATGQCEVLASIKPERIVAKIEQIMRTLPAISEIVEFKQMN
jgi:ADP-heptose:LPS heptosyltransferase